VTFAEIFAGIRGASVAWESLDWKCAWVSETDAFASAVGAYHYAAPNLGDIRAITRDTAPTVDVLIGGPPCQDFSVAGKRAGMEGDRGGMVWEYLRVADELRPRWLVFENVPGLLSSAGGRDFGAVLGAMAERGYMGCYRVLDAQYAGVPQRRRRVFIVGYLGDWRPAAAVLLERESLSGNPPPSREEGEGAAVAITGGTGSRGYPDAIDGGGSHLVARPLASRTGNCSQDESKETFVTAGAMEAREDGGRASVDMNVSGYLQPIAFSCKDGGQDVGEAAPTVRAMPHDRSHPNAGGQVAVVYGFSVGNSAAARSMGEAVQMVPPLKASPSGTNQVPSVGGESMAVRRLTPRECERLQGFPDDYTRIPMGRTLRRRADDDFAAYLRRDYPELTDAEIAALSKDGPRYRVLGNAFPVPVVRWIGERIAMVEKMRQGARAELVTEGRE